MTTPTTVNVQFQLRADTAANWTAANPILLTNEFALETDTKKLKVGDGTTAWASLAYFPSIVTGGTVLGNLEIGSTGTLTFEGATVNDYETTLAVTDPTADRTITLPDQSGTVVVSGNASIVDADIAAGAEIAVSKLANGTVNQVLVTDGTDVSWSDDLTLAGNLTVNGTTTTINTETLVVEDKNIELGVVGTPTDVTADGGGITLKGTTDKTINWIDATDSWTSSENIDLANGKSYRINDTEVLSATTLGSGVTSSSLTSVGTISAGTWQGTAIDAAYLDSTVVTTGDTGTVTSTMIADGTIANVDVSASAAIAGSKIDPDFGSQTIETTGDLAINTNTLFVDASANAVGIGTSGPQYLTHVFGGSDSTNNNLLTVQSNGVASDGTLSTNIRLINSTATSSLHGAEIRAIRASSTTADLSIRLYDTSGSFQDKVYVTGSGRVGIGTAAPGTKFHVVTGANAGITVNQTLATGSWSAGDYTQIGLGVNNQDTVQIRAIQATSSASSYASDIAFINRTTNTMSEKARIDSSGRLLVGTPSAVADASSLLQISSAGGPKLALNLQDGTVTSGQFAASIDFYSFGGFVNESIASIQAFADGAHASGDKPGRLVFSVTADGASSPTEAMRIKNSRILNFANTPVYADNAAAKTGGLVDGDVYRKSDGTLMIVYT